VLLDCKEAGILVLASSSGSDRIVLRFLLLQESAIQSIAVTEKVIRWETASEGVQRQALLVNR